MSIVLMASNHIPDDLLPQILKNLPVKTLIKFQCVCKSWKFLLSSRFFTDDHFNSTTKTGGAPTYLRRFQPWSTHQDLYIIEQDNTRTNVDFPVLQSKRHFVMSFKVIHGVVCLAYALMNDNGWFCNRKFIISFWNPIIRKHVTSCTPFESDWNFSGFGFDSSKNDFKAVWSSIDSCEVFSARDGKWTKTKQPKCDDSLIVASHSSFINGTIHWLTYENLIEFVQQPQGLLLFECEREEFTTIEFPKLVGDMCGDPSVCEYRGLLSFLISFQRGGSIDWELWTMNESTWTKTHTYSNLWTMSEFTRQLACDYKEVDLRMLDDSAFVFKETMLLMDVGQPSQD